MQHHWKFSYRIAGKFGSDLNLAVHATTAKTKVCQYFRIDFIHVHVYTYDDTVPDSQI